MPGAGNAAGFHIAFGEGGAHVGAEVVDCQKSPLIVEDGDHLALDSESFPTTFRYLIGGGNIHKFGQKEAPLGGASRSNSWLHQDFVDDAS